MSMAVMEGSWYGNAAWILSSMFSGTTWRQSEGDGGQVVDRGASR